jgi:hyperosmotically inducible protein
MRAGEQTVPARTLMMGCFPTQKANMKINLASTCLVLGTLLVPFSLHAAESDATDTDRAHPKTFIKDSVITTKIKAKLAEEKIGSLARVRVDTHGRGAVMLSGNVRSKDEAQRGVGGGRLSEGVR